jgi:predicted NBD/HSP70 family sugar kinase
MSIRETERRPEVALAICDLSGVTRARDERLVALDVADPAEALRDALLSVCRAAGLAPQRIRHMHIGVPGSYDPTTDTIHHVDVPGLGRPGLISSLRRRLGAPVEVDNDVNLAAIAERRHGVARGADTFALLWLDHGLGLAIDLGGSLLRGSRGGAGEIGYMPLGLPGTRSAQRDAPDLDGVLAGPAVMTLAAEHGVRADSPARAVETGGAAFIAALAQRVAVAAATVVAVLDPSLIVLAGAVGKAGGARLRDATAIALRASGPLETAIATTSVHDDPVLLGSMDAGLERVREDLIRSIHDTRRP